MYTRAKDREERGNLQLESEEEATSFLLLLGWALGARVIRSPSVDHADQIKEYLVDVRVGFCRCFLEGAVELGCQCGSLVLRDNTFVFCVDFVPDKDDRYVKLFLVRAKNVCPELGGCFKACERGNAIYEHKTLARLHVLITKSRVLFLSCGIHDIEDACGSINFNQLAVRVLDRGIVLFNKVSLNEANRQSLIERSKRQRETEKRDREQKSAKGF